MDNKKFAQELYEAHKLMWMLQHGHTLNEVVQLSSDALIDAIHENPDEQLDCIGFDWEENGFLGKGENGFKKEIWPSFGEFMDNEFRDSAYINNLIKQMPKERQVELAHFHTAEMIKFWKAQGDCAEMYRGIYYGVTQYDSTGVEHRWIFDGESLYKGLYFNGESLPDDDYINIGFPLEASDDSTWITKLDSEEDIRNYLTMPGAGPIPDNPTLEEIGDYLLLVDDGYGSCTDEFVKKFHLDYEELNQTDDMDHHKENVEKMVTALKELGYKDFDYMDPYFGNNHSMSYFDLCGLYQQQVAEKFGIFEKYDLQEEAGVPYLTVNTYYDDTNKDLAMLASFVTKKGDWRIKVSNPLGSIMTGDVMEPINAEKCKFDSHNLEQWTYEGENIWDYETPYPRSTILELAQKNKLSGDDIKVINDYYGGHNVNTFKVPEYRDEFRMHIVKDMIRDGFSQSRIDIVGKDWDAKEILQKPEIKEYYKKNKGGIVPQKAAAKTAKNIK